MTSSESLQFVEVVGNLLKTARSLTFALMGSLRPLRCVLFLFGI